MAFNTKPSVFVGISECKHTECSTNRKPWINKEIKNQLKDQKKACNNKAISIMRKKSQPSEVISENIKYNNFSVF